MFVRLVYDHSPVSVSLESSSSSAHSFKYHDFEASVDVANLIVQKINHILELKPSTKRKEYIALREHKSHRRKSFFSGPRWLSLVIVSGVPYLAFVDHISSILDEIWIYLFFLIVFHIYILFFVSTLMIFIVFLKY